MIFASHPLDIELFRLLHPSNCSPSLIKDIALFISDHFMHLWFLLALVIAIIKGKKDKKVYYQFFLVIIGFHIAWHLTDGFLKPFFDRPRPPIELSNVCIIGRLPSSTSFPSGHTLLSFCTATLLYLFNKKDKWILFLAAFFAVFNGYLRIFLGVHFPTDVLGGAFFGTLVGAAWYWVCLRMGIPIGSNLEEKKEEKNIDQIQTD